MYHQYSKNPKIVSVSMETSNVVPKNIETPKSIETAESKLSEYKTPAYVMK